MSLKFYHEMYVEIGDKQDCKRVIEKLIGQIVAANEASCSRL